MNLGKAINGAFNDIAGDRASTNGPGIADPSWTFPSHPSSKAARR
jgi:hypothetical protein